MSQHPWKKFYAQGFDVNRQRPSRIAVKMTKFLPPKSRILDAGCGRGRNAIFLAGKGFLVDAIDVEDLHFLYKQPKKIKSRIRFYKQSVLKFKIPSNYYQGVLLARLIQYLKPKEVERLINKLSKAAAKGCILALSYKHSMGSGKINAVYPLNNTDHDVNWVKDILKKANFETVNFYTSTHADPKIKGSLPGYGYQFVLRKL
jgi:2-polyprenyl-3-methyl-5-hydroxy-6-metoxy-1,4-benzoquinol methylase